MNVCRNILRCRRGLLTNPKHIKNTGFLQCRRPQTEWVGADDFEDSRPPIYHTHTTAQEPKWMSAEEAVTLINNEDTVFIHGGAATPQILVGALSTYGLGKKLKNVKLVHLHTEGELPVGPEYAGIFRSNSLFMGANVRQAVNENRADYTPCFLMQIPHLFRNRVIPLDVALIQISPPDDHGACTLGVSVDCARAAVQSSRVIIGQVNKHMPRSHGDGQIHISHFDALVQHDEHLPGTFTKPLEPNEVQGKIGRLIANLIEDGSTIQMGIGAIPNAVLSCLTAHADLGVHTEMFTDGIVDLVNKGIITNSKKKKYQGKIVSSFCLGSRITYDFVDDNPYCVLLDCSYVNDPAIISQNPKMVSINSAVEVDITGQIVSDSMGTKIYSGVGGQLDFVRGSSLSEGGKPIIALPSQTNKGVSRIVPHIKRGGGVVTTRAHVHYIVTEYGVADIFGKTMIERARALIDIAHPNHRETLAKAAFERFKVKC